MPGAYQLPTEEYIVDADLVDLYVKIFIPHFPLSGVSLKKRRPCCGYYLYPASTGIVERVERSFSFPEVFEYEVYVREGEEASRYNNDRYANGHVVFSSADNDRLIKFSERVPHFLKVHHKTPEDENGACSVS